MLPSSLPRILRGLACCQNRPPMLSKINQNAEIQIPMCCHPNAFPPHHSIEHHKLDNQQRSTHKTQIRYHGKANRLQEEAHPD